MTDRLLITFVIIAGLALLWLAWRGYKAYLIKSIRRSEATGRPLLLYFTGEYCTVCKFQQAPIVEKITSKFGGAIAVKKVDVSVEPDMASRYRVLTLPTTIVVDRRGQVAHINYGIADQSKLEAQLSGA